MLNDILASLKKKDVEALQTDMIKLTEMVYPNLEQSIKTCSALSGIPEETLVKTCVYVAERYQNMAWQEVFDIVRQFYLFKQIIEKGQ